MIELVSVDAEGSSQELPADASQAVSDTGGVVAYEVSTPDGRRVWIRDRVGDTSRPVAEIDSAAPGISGNGCVVAYSAQRELGIELTVVDRCAHSRPGGVAGRQSSSTSSICRRFPRPRFPRFPTLPEATSPG